jgi:hypothetical protein
MHENCYLPHRHRSWMRKRFRRQWEHRFASSMLLNVVSATSLAVQSSSAIRTSIPNASAIRATREPMAPNPTIPMRFSYSATEAALPPGALAELCSAVGRADAIVFRVGQVPRGVIEAAPNLER